MMDNVLVFENNGGGWLFGTQLAMQDCREQVEGLLSKRIEGGGALPRRVLLVLVVPERPMSSAATEYTVEPVKVKLVRT